LPEPPVAGRHAPHPVDGQIVNQQVIDTAVGSAADRHSVSDIEMVVKYGNVCRGAGSPGIDGDIVVTGARIEQCVMVTFLEEPGSIPSVLRAGPRACHFIFKSFESVSKTRKSALEPSIPVYRSFAQDLKVSRIFSFSSVLDRLGKGCSRRPPVKDGLT
jgi:hypothetical protein